MAVEVASLCQVILRVIILRWALQIITHSIAWPQWRLLLLLPEEVVVPCSPSHESMEEHSRHHQARNSSRCTAEGVPLSRPPILLRLPVMACLIHWAWVLPLWYPLQYQ